jgi:hypothetical protein
MYIYNNCEKYDQATQVCRQGAQKNRTGCKGNVGPRFRVLKPGLTAKKILGYYNYMQTINVEP